MLQLGFFFRNIVLYCGLSATKFDKIYEAYIKDLTPVVNTALFDVFETKGVIHETTISVDVHRKELCYRGLNSVFFILLSREGYLRALRLISINN